MSLRKTVHLAMLPLVGTALAVGGTVSAQDASGALNLPTNPQFFAKEDPNNRTAKVVINGDVITGTDVDQRVALIVAASGGKVADEELARLKLQVMRNLMDESLQIQEARIQEVTIDEAEVDQSYARVAAQNFGQDIKAMDAYLTRIGSSANSLKRQIRGELSWQRLLRRNVQPFVNVSDEEVRDMIKRMQDSKGAEEFRVGEIFLSATEENKVAVFENAKKIVDQLKQGGSFQGYARQYSEASTAAVGGDLGWIRAGQLPTELGSALQTMTPGQLAGPVETRGGFSILLAIDKRQVLTADPRDAVLSLKQVSINFPKGVTPAQATARAKQFADAMQAARGCSSVDAIAGGLGADVVNNDQMKARELQAMVLRLTLGETTPPFGSIEDGVRVLMLCGRDDPKSSAEPNFEEIQSQIEDERVNKRAQTYLRDLRRDAIIDYN